MPVFIVIFLIRCCWNITYYFNVNALSRLISSYIDNHSRDYFYADLIFYTFFEILPTLMVVYIFITQVPGGIKSSQKGDPGPTLDPFIDNANETDQQKLFQQQGYNQATEGQLQPEAQSSSGQHNKAYKVNSKSVHSSPRNQVVDTAHNTDLVYDDDGHYTTLIDTVI